MSNPNKRGLLNSDGSDDSYAYGTSNLIDKRRRISQMEAVEDDIAPEKHAEQHERVKKKFLSNTREGSMPELDMLLSRIVINCDKMNADYRGPRDAEGILGMYPVLKEELEEAWKDGELKRIRLLSMHHLLAISPRANAAVLRPAELLRPAPKTPPPTQSNFLDGM
jgi:hypothetical protein